MIILDASAVVELLTNGPLANSIRRELAAHYDGFLVPHLIDVEVVKRSSKTRGRTASRPAPWAAASRKLIGTTLPSAVRTHH
ncbi:MAG: hypothetical protein JO145_03400 [Acidobacteriaceae bacterium]|nr:hypothetical protein [Acidobacteriaceae bacterium]MBV9767506.1 hypothetical protein [Acidobacteriaceae bacterium]